MDMFYAYVVLAMNMKSNCPELLSCTGPTKYTRLPGTIGCSLVGAHGSSSMAARS